MESKFSDLSNAILWCKKKFRVDDDLTQRWLDDNSQVHFTLKNRTSQNAEFYVNDDPNHTIWYTQLAEIFIQVETLVLCTGEIIKKDGKKCSTDDMDLDSFIAFVKDRTFRVSVNPDGPVAKFDKPKCPYGISYKEMQKLVAELVENKDYEGAAQYLKPATEYNLIEI